MKKFWYSPQKTNRPFSGHEADLSSYNVWYQTFYFYREGVSKYISGQCKFSIGHLNACCSFIWGYCSVHRFHQSQLCHYRDLKSLPVWQSTHFWTVFWWINLISLLCLVPTWVSWILSRIWYIKGQKYLFLYGK